MLERRTFWWACIAIVLAAFVLRVGAAVWWQSRLPSPQSFRFGDSHTYWVLGQNLYRGQPFQFGGAKARIFRTPGYPLMLAALFHISGDQQVLPARILGAGLGTISVALLMCLTWLLFDELTAIVAGTMAAVYPGAVAMSILILSESPFCPWMLGQIICWVLASRVESSSHWWGWAALAGLLAGLGTLVRPSWLLFTPFALVFALVFFPERRRQWQVGAVMMLVLTVTMTPWWIRNFQIAGRWVPTTLQVGASLYDGIRPGASGASDMQFMDAFRRQQIEDDAAAGTSAKGVFEDRLDRRLKQAAVAYAQQHPGDLLRLVGVKLRRMWSPLPNADDLQSPLFRWLILLGYLPLVLASMVGIVRYGWRKWGYFLCFIPALYFSCLHVIFVSSIRYRLPAMLVLTALAAAAMVPRWRPSPLSKLSDRQNEGPPNPEDSPASADPAS